MDSTSPALASIVGSTNAIAAPAAFFVAFTLFLVERTPLPPNWLDGATATSGTGGGDHVSAAHRARAR